MKGKLIWTSVEDLIVEASGVGYEVRIRNSYTTSDLGKEIKLFISHRVSEYGESLYGFGTIEEKILFEALSSMKGIGPKAVFAIMTDLEIKSVSDLSSIKLDDLTKVQGVGKSTAQKFLLALSTKLKTEFQLESVLEKDKIKEEFAEIISALASWGMKKGDLEKFFSDHYSEVQGKNKEKVIQYVLKNMK